jgi:hypothetical protein
MQTISAAMQRSTRSPTLPVGKLPARLFAMVLRKVASRDQRVTIGPGLCRRSGSGSAAACLQGRPNHVCERGDRLVPRPSKRQRPSHHRRGSTLASGHDATA